MCVCTDGELMVDFVDVFVDPAVMQQPMQKVVPGVFNHSAAKTPSQHVWPEEGDKVRSNSGSRGGSNRHQHGGAEIQMWCEVVGLTSEASSPSRTGC